MVPEGWRDAEVGEFVREVVRRGGDDLPVLSVSKDLGIVLQTEKFGRILASDDRRRYKRVCRGQFAYDPMLLWSGSVARQKRVDEGVVSPVYHVFEVDEAAVDPQFVEHVLTAERMLTRYEAISEGTNQRRRKAPFDGFERLSIPLPPLPEQRKIAAILSSVDDAITATREVIEQTEQVKQGLLQRLMTRGIGHTRFKKTEIGEIPEAWEVHRLDSVAQVQTGVAKNSGRTGPQVELPYLRVANVQDGHLDLTEVKTIQVPPDRVSRYRLESGDVLLTEGGDFDKLGRGHIWEGQIDPCLHQNHVFVVRPEQDRLLPAFLNWLTSSHVGKRYFLSCAKQTTNLASINSSQLKAFPALLPPLDEQAEIVRRLGGVSGAVQANERSLAHLHRLKRGLLQDLLTGRVRVTLD